MGAQSRVSVWKLAAACGLLGAAQAAQAQTFAISFGIRETGSPANIGENGGTVGTIEWVNIDAQTLVADGTWQQFTFNFQSDPLTPFTGNGAYDGTRGVLEHIRVRNIGGVTDTLTMWIDDIVNTVSGTPTVVSGFEPTDPFPATIGTEHVFQEPRFSGSTQSFLANDPDTTLVTDQQFHSGTQSNQADFAFNTSDPTSWLRLTTFQTPIQPNPTIDFSNGNSLSFWLRMVVAPPAQRWINPGSGDWDDPNNWGTGIVPNNLGATANFLDDITAPATISLNNPITVTTIRLQSAHGYTIVGGPANNTLTLDGVAEDARTVNAQEGSHTIAAPVLIGLSAGTSALANFNVQRPADVLTLSGDISISIFNNATLTIQKTGPGRLDITNLETPDPIAQPTHILVSGGTMRLLPGSGRTRVNSVAVAGGATPTAKLDITNNPIVADYASPDPSPLDAMKAQIAAGYAGGSWNGNGIISSNATATTHGIGYAEASTLSSVPALFGTVDADAVLMRLTRYGDANLDGNVNLQDFNALASNFGSTDADWVQGDFNYDSMVNLQDFNRLAANFGLAAGPDGPTPQDWAALAAVVPEPTALSALAVAMLPLARRRRRARVGGLRVDRTR
jgi:hypothetical protein